MFLQSSQKHNKFANLFENWIKNSFKKFIPQLISYSNIFSNHTLSIILKILKNVQNDNKTSIKIWNMKYSNARNKKALHISQIFHTISTKKTKNAIKNWIKRH